MKRFILFLIIWVAGGCSGEESWDTTVPVLTPSDVRTVIVNGDGTVTGAVVDCQETCSILGDPGLE